MDNIVELASKYRRGAEGTSDRDYKVANKWHDYMHSQYLILRESNDGRLAIAALFCDLSPHVRIWAATHSLAWNAAAAVTVLEEIRDSDGPCSFDAKIVIE